MKLLGKILSMLLTFAVLSTAGAATGINPPKENIDSYLNGYDLRGENNSLELACEVAENATELGWNCDIYVVHFAEGKDIIVNTFYHYEENKKGYKACYYWLGPQHKEVEDISKKQFKFRTIGSNGGFGCEIKGMRCYERVKSYFGKDLPIVENNETVEENTTTVVEENESCEPPVDNITEEAQEQDNNTDVPEETCTGSISFEAENYSSNNSVKLTADLNKPSKGMLDEIAEAFKHILYAVHLN